MTPTLPKEAKKANPVSGFNGPTYAKSKDLMMLERLGMPQTGSSPKSLIPQLLAKQREFTRSRLAANHSNPRVYIELGDIHFANKKFYRSREAYISALKYDQDNAAIIRKIIGTYIAEADIESAQKYFKKLTEVSPDTQSRHDYLIFQLAQLPSTQLELNAINNELELLMKQSPEDASVLVTAGIFMANFKHDLSLARKFYDKAIKIDPSNVHAINDKGASYLEEGNLTEASGYFKRAISIDPNYFAAYENTASLQIAKGDFRGALGTLEYAIEKKVSLSTLWENKIGWLLIQLKDYDRAIEWHEDKIFQEPHSHSLLNNLGYCLMQTGDLERAEELFRQALRNFEKEAPFVVDSNVLTIYYDNLINILSMQGRYTESEDIARQLIKFNDTDAAGFFYRGDALIKRAENKNPTFACICFERSIELDPSVPDPYVALAYTYETMLSKFSDAITLLTNLPFPINDYPMLVNNLAYAYIKNDELMKAKKLLDNYQDSNEPTLFATKGLVCLYEGDIKKATALYEKAIAEIQPQAKDFARQVWAYERASYWLKSKDYKQAIDAIEEALEFKDISYAYALSKQLRKNIPKQSKAPK